MKSKSDSNGTSRNGEYVVPLPIQTFLWRQSSSFLRPKLGKMHEASCMFCQQAAGHHEMKEACKSLEKVLVQNIQFGLSPSLSEALRSFPRWKLIQTALPHVMLCTAQLLNDKKEAANLQNVGTAASKLLYTLHWALLDAAEECADADREAGRVQQPRYIFSLTSIQTFVYLFTPLRHLLKEAELQNFRLENGLKIWPALWDYRHPDAACFTTTVKTHLAEKSNKPAPVHVPGVPADLGQFGDVFIGSDEHDLSIGAGPSSHDGETSHVASPKENDFPETIPEETSSTEEEHVVIFRLTSPPDPYNTHESVYKAESSILQPRWTVQDVTPLCELPKTTGSGSSGGVQAGDYRPRRSSVLQDVMAATILDIAVLRCLFAPQWQEEGVHWALQFLFYRLQEINEELRWKCPQRQRSNSVPVPKIQVSLCVESNHKKEFQDTLTTTDETAKCSTTNISMSSASSHSDKETIKLDEPTLGAKKKLHKMADLKAFVETKLWSRSDKAIEKIGSGSKHHDFNSSLMAVVEKVINRERDLIPPRPLSALAKVSSDGIKVPEGIDQRRGPFLGSGMLVKGKSMPSLSCLLDELTAGYIGLNDSGTTKKTEPQGTRILASSKTHPLITVTDHTPTLSQEFHRFPEEDNDYSKHLKRCVTDPVLAQLPEDIPEAAGSAAYVTNEGGFNFYVVLKAVHKVLQREEICSIRVCETALNLLELLIELGVLATEDESKEESSPEKEKPKEGDIADEDKTEDQLKIAHALCMESIIRVFLYLGCPHGCGADSSRRGSSSEYIRSQGFTLLGRLHRSSGAHFQRFLRTVVATQFPLTEVVDFLHALLGFCMDPGFTLSPLSQKRFSRFGLEPSTPGSYTPSYGRNVENQVITSMCKALMTRFTTNSKWLKNTENLGLYCDVRQLLAYIKDVHSSAFRRVMLSGLLDTVSKPERVPGTNTPDKAAKNKTTVEESEDMGAASTASFFVVDETVPEKPSTSKKLTRKMTSTALSGDLSDEDMPRERRGSVAQPFALILQKGRDKSKDKSKIPLVAQKRKNSKFAIAVGWIKKDKNRSGEDSTELALTALGPSYHKLQGRGPPNQVTTTLQRAKRRMELHLNRMGIGRNRKPVNSREATPDPSRRNSMDVDGSCHTMEPICAQEKKLVNCTLLHAGMLRFSFLMETCQPGCVPDAQVMAVILDLPQAPVISRACFLLECAHFVHRCAKGQWPSWMKLNLPLFRPSGPLANRGTPSGQRRTHLLQRVAGRMFYSWAEAIGLRLEEMILEESIYPEEIGVPLITAEDIRAKRWLEEDENEDFLVEASVNPSGSDCPWALRLTACMLLHEITCFLREAYRRLPRSARVSLRSTDRPSNMAGNSGGSLCVGTWNDKLSVLNSSDTLPPINPMSAAAAAVVAQQNLSGRRWSMALSSMGHSQNSAQSLQSIPDGHPNGVSGERKISFVLHEPDDESLGSSNTTLTFQGEDGGEERDRERKSRRLTQGRSHLLRRSTMGNAPGSFRRRSLKLRRSHRERREADTESIKRSDSLRSKRKVSSLSDRSDTSDHHDQEISGEESPGLLSDDQPPESPSEIIDADDAMLSRNIPWIKTVIQMSNAYNFFCTHQGFCHPKCYRRQMRACSRILRAVRKVYGDDVDETQVLFPPKARDENRKEKKKEAFSRPGSPSKRRESMGKKDKIDKNLDSNLLSKLSGSQGSISGPTHREITELESGFNNLTNTQVFDRSGEPKKKKKAEEEPMLKYLKSEVLGLFQIPLSLLLKTATLLHEDAFLDMLPVVWEWLLEPNAETSAAAAALYILAAVRCPEAATSLLHRGLTHPDANERVNALSRFQVLWRCRYQVWQRMEEGAQSSFKVPPHAIEFTLPSPKIGIESMPVVDPPWMPESEAKVEEVTLNQDTHRALVTATKTRKKQQTELVQAALQAEQDRKRVERENFWLTSVPIIQQASYEPALHHSTGDDHDEDDEAAEGTNRSATHQPVQVAQSLFPSCLCSAAVYMVGLLDDTAITADGLAVYQVAHQVIDACLVEDSTLFLRHFLEKLTRDKQDEMFHHLRRLLRFIPRLPPQTAYVLHNYLIGYIMFYVRTPQEGGQEMIASALSLLTAVIPSVQGLLFKDLKQILRKEQCDASILITANVPSAKKIIVHGPQGPDSGGIPSQFPVQEDTQFCQIWQEAVEFFDVEEGKHKEYFLVDHRTGQIHNPSSYVRDFYFFKRSQYPQLCLVHMPPAEAYEALQRQAVIQKSVEIGKVLFTSSVLTNHSQTVARVLFLHEELMKLPSFPRKALEAEFDLYKSGPLGKELRGLDLIHKIAWVRLVAKMFEAMAGNFAYSGDIHLFVNVVNGALVLHCEDAGMLRLCMATYINAAHQFRNIFALNGYLLIIPTLLRLYSNSQGNGLLTQTIEFTLQQFYILHRKPFLLQLFGSVAPILDADTEALYGDATKVRSESLFQALLALEKTVRDPLHILDLVTLEKPMKPLDFCYHGESDSVTVLDCIALCVVGVSYAPDTPRGHHLLMILESIVPMFLHHLQSSDGRKDPRSEREAIQQIAAAMKTLLLNSEALAKHYTGPQRLVEKTSSQRNCGGKSTLATAIEMDEDSHSRFLGDYSKTWLPYDKDGEDSEGKWEAFRQPRSLLLNLVADYFNLASGRLAELNKKNGMDGKNFELLDVKCHMKLADVAHSLLKFASYDAVTMGCKGLQSYVTYLMPATDWSHESMRPALNTLSRRLDKIFLNIHKMPSVRRNIDWKAATGLLQGFYTTLTKCPYIVHVQHLRSLIATCQSLILGESATLSTGGGEMSPLRVCRSTHAPPSFFSSVVVRLIAMQILALGLFSHISMVNAKLAPLRMQETYSLEQACGGTSIFPTPDRTEAVLLNLLLPLFLKVGNGRKDAPHLRQSDISFALTVILHALNPPRHLQPGQLTGSTNHHKISTSSAVSMPSGGEHNCPSFQGAPSGGSCTGSLGIGSPNLGVTLTTAINYDVSKLNSAQPQQLQRVRASQYKVAFMGLKLMMVCFTSNLAMDWPRIGRFIKEMNEKKEGGAALWSFLDFVASFRTPLYVILLPLMNAKVATPVVVEEEQALQAALQSRLKAGPQALPPRGALIAELAIELRDLREELSAKKEDESDTDMRRSVVFPDLHSDISNASNASRRFNPELTYVARRGSIRDLHLNSNRSLSASNSNVVTGLCTLRRQWSVRSDSRTPVSTSALSMPGSRPVNLQASTTSPGFESWSVLTDKGWRRTSYAGESVSQFTGHKPLAFAPDFKANRRSLAIAENLASTIVENKSSPSGEQLTPSTGDTSRLQRPKQGLAKGKTFRFKKPIANIEVSHIEIEPEKVFVPPMKSSPELTPYPFQRLLVPTSSVSASSAASASPIPVIRSIAASPRKDPPTPVETVVTSSVSPHAPPKVKISNASVPAIRSPTGNPSLSVPVVTVGMAIQVSTSTYAPPTKFPRPMRPPLANLSFMSSSQAPPPIPPRSPRGAAPPYPAFSVPEVQKGRDQVTAGPRACLYREREPPLIEEGEQVSSPFGLTSFSPVWSSAPRLVQQLSNVSSDAEAESSRSSLKPCLLTPASSSAESLTPTEQRPCVDTHDEDTLI